MSLVFGTLQWPWGMPAACIQLVVSTLLKVHHTVPAFILLFVNPVSQMGPRYVLVIVSITYCFKHSGRRWTPMGHCVKRQGGIHGLPDSMQHQQQMKVGRRPRDKTVGICTPHFCQNEKGAG
ncbi:hypothetical protein DFH07DRAFT_768828 [Mycena maculata]|uniref:Uncharacterized protein n=1 Tax=Mycena maculata TaxID=230809 RepID=A0AAD7NPD3_9AGAR|nr:hypothetical protein DFH07DRAFT_768828 [Mycena maculata]